MSYGSKCVVAARAFLAYTEGRLDVSSKIGRERAVMSLAGFLSTVPYSAIYDTAVHLVLRREDVPAYPGEYVERCCNDTASTFVAVYAMADVCRGPSDVRKQLGASLLQPLNAEWQLLYWRAVV
jgi:hypothetical protein